jgi:lysozyme
MNDLIPSAALIQHVQDAESLVLVPSPDPVGILTYGWGHRTYAGEIIPPFIDVPTALLILTADLHKAAQSVRQYVLVALTQDQFDALTDFTFNLGAVALASSTMLSCVNRQDWTSAAEECERWVHDHAGHVLNGLVTRRAWDAARLQPSVTPAQEIVYVASIMPPDGVVPDNLPLLTIAPDGSLVLPIANTV